MLYIKRAYDGQFFYTVNSDANGQTLLTSETYTRKSKCQDAIKAVLKEFAGTSVRVTDQSNLTTRNEGESVYTLHKDGSRTFLK